MSDSDQATAPVEPLGGKPIQQPAFLTTHWSVVLSARDQASPQSAAALERLCRSYWYPLYAHVRRLGNNPHDAEDLTQGFFARLLEKHYLDAADRERGRFRTFLLMALKRFLADQWDRARAGKRGGGHAPLPLDTAVAEQRFQTEPASLPEERAFEQCWARAVLQQAMARLRQEFEQAGKVAEFERLKIFLAAGKPDIPYAAVARERGLSEEALRVAVHRLRRRFRELLRAEVANTVASAEDVDEEFRHLRAVLSE